MEDRQNESKMSREGKTMGGRERRDKEGGKVTGKRQEDREGERQ